MPRWITVILKDDLVDTCKAGNDVTVVGTVIERWQRPKPGRRTAMELVLLANNVQQAGNVTDSRVLTDEYQKSFENFWTSARERNDCWPSRNLIVSSVAPHIFGLDYGKLAVLLALLGGVATG